MESILAILCIVFLAVLTYGLVQGHNLTKEHLYNCRTIYIPEDIDLETAYNSVVNKDLNGLKKRASELGARKQYLDTFDDKETSPSKLKEFVNELQKYIIRNSISDEHILFEEIDKKIDKKESKKMKERIKHEVDNMTLTDELKSDLSRDLGIDSGLSIPAFKNELIKIMIKKHSGIQDFKDPYITIQELRNDANMDG